MDAKLNQAKKLINQAKKILVFTGAGISTGSGIPDFRGPNGVWKTRQPVYYQDFMNSEAARIEYWDYKLQGWEHFSKAQPNKAHVALVSLEQKGKLHCLVTQNIDGLHRKAGNTEEKIVEIHGTNALIECQNCLERSLPEPHFLEFQRTRKAPNCHCGGYLKPATISFGQSLRESDLQRAYKAILNCDLVLAIGSTLSVSPANTIPLEAAKNGAPYIIINRGETEHDDLALVTLRIEGDVVDVLPQIV